LPEFGYALSRERERICSRPPIDWRKPDRSMFHRDPKNASE
jgi:hypothetical protein